MRSFFFNNITSKITNMRKYVRTTKFLRKLVVTTPKNSIAFTRKPVNTLNSWNDTVVFYSYLINKPLQHVIDYEKKNNKNRQKRKVPEEGVDAI